MATGQDTILGTDTVKDALKTKVNDDMTELFAILDEVEAARDGENTLLDQINILQLGISALAAESGAVVSADDKTVGFLDGKLLAGEAIDLTVGDPAGDETLTISCEDASATNKGVVELATSDEASSGTDATRAITSVTALDVLRAKFLL